MAAFTEQQVLDAIENTEYGGGEMYADKLDPSDADVEVSTESEFENALSGPTQTIAVTDDINLSNGGYNIRSHTIVGDRGWDGSDGPLLYTNSNGYDSSSPMGSNRPHTMLWSDENPRISGVRLRGDDYDRGDNFYPTDSNGGDVRSTLATAFKLVDGSAEIDNCEIYGFAWCNLMLRGGDGHFHHNSIHTAPQMGYGYGVNLWETNAPTYANMHHNYFNRCRHVVAGRGHYQVDYDAWQNVIGPNHANHIFDMHCLVEDGIGDNSNRSATDFALRAGGLINIYENTITNEGYDIYYNSSTGNAIDIRGEPWDEVNIYRNWFTHENEPSRNESNTSSREAYKQSNTRDSTWGPIASSGEFTDNYNAYNNKFDMRNTSYEEEYGANIDIASGGATGVEFVVNVRDEDGNGREGADVTLLRDNG